MPLIVEAYFDYGTYKLSMIAAFGLNTKTNLRK